MYREDRTYNPLLEIIDLSIGYPEKRKRIKILQKDLNLKLYKGDLVCLIGPNGCGKSTLIRSIACLQPSLSGRIIVDGVDVNTLTDRKRSDLFSIVLTDRTAVDGITVSEIVALGCYQSSDWLGSLNEMEQQRTQWAIAQVGLQGFEDRMYYTLSDGEKQRAFIAKALSSDAPVMLLDEPTAHLDVPNRVEVMSLLQRFTCEFEHSVILSTHDLDLALQMADQIWLMIPGKGIYIGTPEELLHLGYLDKVFGNETLRFNPHAGNFIITKKNSIQVQVEGEGRLYDITVQALRRIGYVNNKTGKAEIKIIIGEDRWVVDYKDSMTEFNNLTEFCRFLKNHR